MFRKRTVACHLCDKQMRKSETERLSKIVNNQYICNECYSVTYIRFAQFLQNTERSQLVIITPTNTIINVYSNIGSFDKHRLSELLGDTEITCRSVLHNNYYLITSVTEMTTQVNENTLVTDMLDELIIPIYGKAIVINKQFTK